MTPNLLYLAVESLKSLNWLPVGINRLTIHYTLASMVSPITVTIVVVGITVATHHMLSVAAEQALLLLITAVSHH